MRFALVDMICTLYQQQQVCVHIKKWNCVVLVVDCKSLAKRFALADAICALCKEQHTTRNLDSMSATVHYKKWNWVAKQSASRLLTRYAHYARNNIQQRANSKRFALVDVVIMLATIYNIRITYILNNKSDWAVLINLRSSAKRFALVDMICTLCQQQQVMYIIRNGIG